MKRVMIWFSSLLMLAASGCASAGRREKAIRDPIQDMWARAAATSAWSLVGGRSPHIGPSSPREWLVICRSEERYGLSFGLELAEQPNGQPGTRQLLNVRWSHPCFDDFVALDEGALVSFEYMGLLDPDHPDYRSAYLRPQPISH